MTTSYTPGPRQAFFAAPKIDPADTEQPGYQTILDHTQLRPGDLLEYRCPHYGLVTQWRVVAVLLGAEGIQSLLEIEPLTKMMPPGVTGTLLVPEQMTRALKMIRPGMPSPATGPNQGELK